MCIFMTSSLAATVTSFFTASYLQKLCLKRKDFSSGGRKAGRVLYCFSLVHILLKPTLEDFEHNLARNQNMAKNQRPVVFFLQDFTRHKLPKNTDVSLRHPPLRINFLKWKYCYYCRWAFNGPRTGIIFRGNV